MSSHTIMGDPHKDIEFAAISVIHHAVKEFKEGAQVVHIILASIIKTGGEWKAVASIVREPDVDFIVSEAIVFCHLPDKYNDLLDVLLPEVDHLNLITDESIWKNIKVYLLDVYFYQAVHFKKLERITETGGGYFKETKENTDLELDAKILSLELQNNKFDSTQGIDHLFDASFYRSVETNKIQELETEKYLFWKKHIDTYRPKYLS